MHRIYERSSESVRDGQEKFAVGARRISSGLSDAAVDETGCSGSLRKLAKADERNGPLGVAGPVVFNMQIAEFQQFIRERYFPTDSARGAPATFLWFTEEVGELAHAIAKHHRGDRSADDRTNLQEEFADVLAWLTTLANILEVDLTDAVKKKYFDHGGPTGNK